MLDTDHFAEVSGNTATSVTTAGPLRPAADRSARLVQAQADDDRLVGAWSHPELDAALTADSSTAGTRPQEANGRIARCLVPSGT